VRRAVALLLVAGLVGGLAVAVVANLRDDDPYAEYCAVVEDRQDDLTKIVGEGGPDVLLRALPVFRDLQDAAPSDIADDWRLVVTGLAALQAALDDAGVDPATYDRENPPEGVTDAERDRIDAAAQALTADDTVAAFANVEQQARDVCKTPLRL
jgi:hypothetical protein